MSSGSINNSSIQLPPRVPEPECVRVGPIVGIPALLGTHTNESPDKIIEDAGVDPKLLEDPDNSISFVAAERLLNLCAKRTGIPHFGQLLGQQSGLEVLGQLAELSIYAPNVGTALQGMIQHICIHDRGGVPTLVSKNGIAKMGYAIYIPMNDGTKHVCSTSLTIICNLFRSLCGEKWAPSKVLFSHSRPIDTKPYESFFRAPLIYEAEEDALIFNDCWLHKALPGADLQQHIITLRRLATVESGMGIDLLEEIRMILRPMIVSQSCSLERLASTLSLHPRTLNRRLKDRGTSFREMVAELRFELAKQLLIDNNMSLIKISTLLGYAEASVFTRSFRRWSGTTPSAWCMRQSSKFMHVGNEQLKSPS